MQSRVSPHPAASPRPTPTPDAAIAYAVVNALVDGVITLDASGTIRFANPAALTIFGYSHAELIGQKITLLVPELQSNKQLACIAGDRRISPSWATDVGRRVVGRRQDGSQFPLELGVTEVPECEGAGEGRLFAGVVRDVSARVDAEQQLERTRIAGTRSERNRTGLLRAMSHELRTPLTTIVGFGEILEQEVAAPELAELARTVRRSAQEATELLETVIELSLADAGWLELANHDFDLGDVIGLIEREVAPLAAEKGLKFELLAHPAGIRCRSDRGQVQRILDRLLRHAIRQTPSGTVTLTVASRPEGESIVSVTDTGPGHPPPDFDSVFSSPTGLIEVLQRGGPTVHLGLAYAYRLAERIGGKLQIQAIPQVGTQYTLRLPQREWIDARRIEAPPQGTPLKIAALDRRSRRVLITDDVEANRFLLERIMRQAGYRVQTSVDGFMTLTEALLAAAANDPFDLILMDLQMPNMDGVTATRRLREAGISAPVIAVSSHVGSANEATLMAAGFTAMMPKPIQSGRLLELAERAIALHAATVSRQADAADEIVDWFGGKMPRGTPQRA